MNSQCKKKIIIMIIFFLIMFLNLNVYAKDTGKCDKTTAENRFGITSNNDIDNGKITVAIKNGAFDVTIKILDSSYVPKDGEPEEKVLKEEKMTLNANSKNGNIVKELNYAYDKTQSQIIKVILNFTDTNDSVCGYRANQLEYELFFTIPGSVEVKQKQNTHYNGLCAKLRNGIWDDKFKKYVSKEVFEKYNPAATNSASIYASSLAVYCYKEYVTANYSEDTVAMLIGNAVKSYKNSLKTTIDIPDASPDIPNENRYDLSKETSDDAKRFRQGLKLTCDSKNLGTIGKFSYANKQVYYATDTKTTTLTLKHTVTCTKKCSETLTVEYGPPVATKAGLCFEYKVKVQSEVKCDSTVSGGPPTPDEYPVCVPVPWCNGLKDKEHQAGPTDEFDSCVNSCDGGIYTQACINKCYNQVYENTTSKKLNSTYYNPAVLKLFTVSSTCDYSRSNGYYTRANGTTGEITAWIGEAGTCTAYAPYYFIYEGEKTARDHNSGAYVPNSQGFKYNSNGCRDNCRYTGCSNGEPLSEEEADTNYHKDLEAYEAFVSECNAQASCSTKSAEFTIKVNNKTTDNPNTDNWIDYNASILNRVPTDASNIILDKSGCYGEGTIDKSYLTEWSFPGTWVNNKTGEIKYEPVTGKAWHKKQGKFCTNLKSKDVNELWWYYGMTGDLNYYPSAEDLEKLEYNIKATAKNFGHYSWNMDISCFYALYETSNKKYDPEPDCDCLDPECAKTNESCNNPTKTSTLSYKIRTVDNKDLFPSTDETSTSDSTKTGRTPGFNWTAEATNIKNTNYVIAPSVLMERIQEKKDDIYADDNDSSSDLDYRFYLDKATLKKIRDYTKNEAGGKYTNFNGTFTVENGVSVYNSPLFRGTGSTIDTKFIKKIGRLGCNNQATSDRCENYSSLLGTIGG